MGWERPSQPGDFRLILSSENVGLGARPWAIGLLAGFQSPPRSLCLQVLCATASAGHPGRHCSPGGAVSGSAALGTPGGAGGGRAASALAEFGFRVCCKWKCFFPLRFVFLKEQPVPEG